MVAEVVKFAFVAGELSPAYYGRADLEKFDLGVGLAKNFVVDYKGGISNRQGTEFCDYLKGEGIVLAEFQFKSNIANTYLLVLGDSYVRFVQDGAYVLESAKTISGMTSASPGVVTSAAHGYSNGDWVKILTRTFVVTSVTTNTFQLYDPFGNAVSTVGQTALLAATQVRRIYTVASPWAEAYLDQLDVKQQLDRVVICHNQFPPYELIRLGSASWTLTAIDVGNAVDAPENLVGTTSASGNASFTWCVTATNTEGEQSQRSDIYLEDAAANFTTTAASYRYEWDASPGAQYYNVYRSLVLEVPGSGALSGTTASLSAEMGFIGRAYAPNFYEANIVPDFTSTPPQFYNPFAGETITLIEVTAGGTGYLKTSTVSVSGGTGFLGQVVVNDGGEVIAILVLNGGSGFTTPVVTVTDGTGATFTVETSPATGNYPAISSIFQQRQVYAASINHPVTVWGSRPVHYNNFDTSNVISDSDAYEFDLDSPKLNPIKHIISLREGLLIMSDSGIWKLTGGQEAAVTPTNALADIQTYTGIADVDPIIVDTELLYVEAKGSTVRMLEYNEFSKVYRGVDVSILSSHFFTHGKRIDSWGFAAAPQKIVWSQRNDGALLAFTTVKEQGVFAWTQNWTQGKFRWVKSLGEDDRDSVYFAVERYVGGSSYWYLERLASREFSHVEDAWFVDSGLSLSATYPAANISSSTSTGETTFTASSAIFTPLDVGKVLRMSGGKAVINTYNSTTSVDGYFLRDINVFIPETTTPDPAQSGEWTLDSPVTILSNLWHLEGKEAVILGDGNVMLSQVVEGGQVVLEAPITRGRVGLGYRGIVKTLPPFSSQVLLEGKRKIASEAIIRLSSSRGLSAGTSLTSLYELKERTNEVYGEPIELVDGTKVATFACEITEEGEMYFVQDYPLPVTILGYVLNVEPGDDNG